MTILSVHNVRKIYGSRVQFEALKSISFTVEEGEFIGIMGPSGSGKTTLLNVISTIDKPSSGSVRIQSTDVQQMKGDALAKFRRQQLGFVFQDFNLLATLTVKENIVLPLVLEGVPTREQERRVNEIAPLLGIDSILAKRTYEISGGQAQRTAIARAIIHQPSLLLADEPTGNLDSKAARDVMQLFQHINEEKQATMVMVTHDALAASYCSRVLFIKDGEIFNEIRRGAHQQAFYQQIIDVLSLLGGHPNDLSSVRL